MGIAGSDLCEVSHSKRNVNVKDGVKVNPDDVIVSRIDFERALQEVKPMFGFDSDEFENWIRNGIINYGPKVQKLIETGRTFIEQVKNSSRTPLVSVLLEGINQEFHLTPRPDWKRKDCTCCCIGKRQWISFHQDYFS